MKHPSWLLRAFVFGTAAVCAVGREAAAQDPVCLAIGLPVVSGLQGNADEHGIALRDVFTSYLTGPATKVVALDAKLASQAPAEAKQKGCNLVLALNATGKHNGPSMFSKVASEAGRQASWHVPYGGTVGSAAARGAAIGGAAAIANIAAGTRAKDEMKLEYRVTSVDGKTVLKNQEAKLKASVDGEDIITPLVRKASEAIVAAVVK